MAVEGHVNIDETVRHVISKRLPFATEKNQQNPKQETIIVIVRSQCLSSTRCDPESLAYKLCIVIFVIDCFVDCIQLVQLTGPHFLQHIGDIVKVLFPTSSSGIGSSIPVS